MIVRQLFPVPTPAAPSQMRCVSVYIPDSMDHLAAFAGALALLGKWNSWQKDEAHSARLAALAWQQCNLRGIHDCENGDLLIGIDLGDDMGQNIRISPDDSCIIQMWCIDHWEDWYDPRKCIVTGSAQPSGDGELDAGECATFTAKLDGNGKWLLPVPVSAGDTIAISSAVGGWWDGNVLHAWNCPSGLTYALGACVSAGATDAGSPIPSLSIGRLIAQIGSFYLDAFNQVIPVPSGITDENVYFQMNDATLGDNAGSVSFGVEVCKASEDNTVLLNYLSGSGPASAEFGESFIVNLADDGSVCSGVTVYECRFETNHAVAIEVISLVNFNSQTNPPCGNSADGYLIAPDHSIAGTYANPYTTSFPNQGGWDVNSMDVGCTALLRLTRP